jgi:hypothetical protein
MAAGVDRGVMHALRRLCVVSLWIAATVLAVVLIAGCGSASHPSGGGTNAAKGVSPDIRVARCMRAHGVPNYPDSGITPGSAITQSPAFGGAFRVCAKALHHGNPPPASPGVVRQQLAFSQCMRAHGVPNFPDPNASGFIQFPVSSPLPKSPAFQRAANGPCKRYQSR